MEIPSRIYLLIFSLPFFWNFPKLRRESTVSAGGLHVSGFGAENVGFSTKE
jgi:hypothetical protein